jgi:hypothetical protein
MLGRHSLRNSLLFNPEPERIIRKANQERRKMVEERPEEEIRVGENQRTLRDYFLPATHQALPIRRPGVDNPYEIKSSTISLLSAFYSNAKEDPYRHLEEFTKVCSTVKLQGFTNEALMRTLFACSLKDKAKHWYHTLDARGNDWATLKGEFLKKYFLMSKTNHYIREIMGFTR